MTTHTKSAGRKRRRPVLVNILLLIALCLICFFIFKEARGYSVERAAQSGMEESGNTANGGYQLLHMDCGQLGQGELVLVNGGHPYDFSVQPDLVSIYDYKEDCYLVRDKNVLLDRAALEHLNDMMADFSRETGKRDVNVVAGFRTYDTQQNLYDDSVAEKGQEYTSAFVALPGSSEHHTGLAVDFSIYHMDDGTSESFDGSGDYGWISENAWEYGFVQRYEADKSGITMIDNEPWHYRYVGKAHAYYMTQNKLCLEEYIELVRKYSYDSEHLRIECGEQEYAVWFCRGSAVRVPEKGSYTISGDNDAGYIVTAYVQETGT